MERMSSLMLLISLLIMFASVVSQIKADECQIDGLGTCENCDQRCKDKHGPSSQGSCDRTFSVPLCNCFYACPEPTPTPPQPCSDSGGLCSAACPESCCNANCAQKHPGGHGFCTSLGNTNLCQCEFPC